MQCSQCGQSGLTVSETGRCPSCDARAAATGSDIPSVRPVLPGVFLVFGYLLGPLLCGAMFGLAAVRRSPDAMWLGLAAALSGVVWLYVLMYRAWSAIQDGHARTTPGRAVGRSFIPYYNMYWIFVAIGAWGEEYNAFAERNDIAGFRASAGVFRAWATFSFLSMLAVFGLGFVVSPSTFHTLSVAAGIPLYLVLPIGMMQMCRGINAVAGAAAGPSVPAARAL